MKNDGPNTITFKDGQKIIYGYPTSKLGGMLWGDLTINIEGTMTFEDKQNNLKAVIILHHKKWDRLVGKIYHPNPDRKQKSEPSKISEIKDIG